MESLKSKPQSIEKHATWIEVTPRVLMPSQARCSGLKPPQACKVVGYSPPRPHKQICMIALYCALQPHFHRRDLGRHVPAHTSLTCQGAGAVAPQGKPRPQLYLFTPQMFVQRTVAGEEVFSPNSGTMEYTHKHFSQG